MANTSLHVAKAQKEDEFYTQRGDIEEELSHYAEHFKDKVVYCNCDDPKESEFWQFFVRVFTSWGIKKLIATHYDPNEENFTYKLEAEPDKDGQFSFQWEPVKTPLPCNGDFRSAACIELLKEADIVVTNPPFSLWRQYLAQLMEYNKKFLIIGSQNNITYKEVFPLFKDNLLWVGYHFGDMSFKVPPYYEPRETRYWQDETGQKWRSMGNICWYTNLDISKRHTPLDLRGNYYEGNEDQFPHYDNYDAIEVKKVSDIPSDYKGAMGVPITFLDKYCPEQFEIVGMTTTVETGMQINRIYKNAVQHNKNGTTTSGGKVNTRSAILVKEKPLGVVYYTADDVDGYLLAQYPRILIRHKED